LQAALEIKLLRNNKEPIKDISFKAENIKVEKVSNNIELLKKYNLIYENKYIIKYEFTAREIATKLELTDEEIKDVSFVSGWIDANCDGKFSKNYEKWVEIAICRGITKEMLVAMECIEASNNQELIDALNKYCCQHEINTPLRVAHFLAQAATESGGFTKFVEDGTYKESIAIQSSYYSAYRNSIEGKNIQLIPRKDRNGNIQRDNDGNIIYNCKQPEYFNCKYGGKQGNTKVEPLNPKKQYYYQINDGFNYRGRGLIQITFRDTYKNFTTRYNAKNPDDIKDFEANPNLLEQIKYAVASACDYWANKYNPKLGKNLNSLADEGVADEVMLKISGTVNGYWKLNADEFNHLSAYDKTLYTKANDNFYIKTPNGYNERLEKFHKLKQYLGL